MNLIKQRQNENTTKRNKNKIVKQRKQSVLWETNTLFDNGTLGILWRITKTHSEPPGVSKSCVCCCCCLLWNSLSYILLFATQRTITSAIILLSHFFCVLVYLCARWQFGWVWEIHLPVTSSLCGFSESWLKRNVHDVWNEGRRAILLLSVLLMDRYNVFDELQAHFFVLYVHLLLLTLKTTA